MHDPALDPIVRPRSHLGSHSAPATFNGEPLRVMQVIAGGREGGAETFFVSLAVALHRAGLDQLVVIRRNLARSMALRRGGIEPVELPFGRWFDFHTVPVLRRQAKIYQPHVVMTWMNRASGAFPRGDFLRLARLGGFYDLKHYRRCDHLIGITPGIVEHVVDRGWPRARAHYLLGIILENRIETAGAEFDKTWSGGYPSSRRRKRSPRYQVHNGRQAKRSLSQ